MQIDLVAESFVTRFTGATIKLCQIESPRLLLAISGGADSLALMLLAHQAMPSRIAGATVDHKLRPDAADEAKYVARLCAERGIPHQILHPEQPITGNIQSAARVARYALLEQAAEDADCQFIVTAHHADDQLETLLMRLARGSGVDGMSGIRSRNGRIIRPLLGFSKSELEEICASAHLTPVRDPSNEHVEFDRVAMRQWLASAPHPFNAHRAYQTSSSMNDAAVAIRWMTDHLSGTRLKRIDDEVQCDANNLPHELQRRLALASLAILDPDFQPRGSALERLIEQLNQGQTTTIGNILCKGGDVWRFSPAPPRRSGQQIS